MFDRFESGAALPKIEESGVYNVLVKIVVL